MAFGSAAVGLGGASRADVVLRADIGQFRKDITEARELYQRSTGQMSDATLRMQVAQEKLDRAIAKYGAESRQAKEATLRYRAEMRSLEQQTERTERETRQAQRSLDRLSRGAVAGSGIFKGLGRSIAFASASFLGGAGFVYALRSTVNAAKEAEASSGRVAIAVRNAGLEYEKHKRQIDQTIAAQSRLAALDDEDLADSFAKLVIRTKDVTEALKLNALAADVARGRQISLEAATQLVIKASLGQAGQLRRVGIEVDKNAKAQELLTKLTQAYGGQAERYASSAAGAQEKLSVAIENTQEALGGALLPTINHYASALADWLNDADNQKRLQNDVNAAIKAGTGIVKGLTAALKIVATVAEPVVDALGGIEKAAQLALIVGIATKARKAALGFLPLQASSLATAEKGVRDAGVFGRAWDVATRPRTLIVTETTTTTGPSTGPNPSPPGDRDRTPPVLGVPGRGSGRGMPRPRSVVDRINQYGRNIPKTVNGLPLKGLPTGFLSGIVLYGGFTVGSAAGTIKSTPAYNFETGQWLTVWVDPSGQAHVVETSEASIKKEFPAFWQGVRSRLARQQPKPPGPDEGTRGSNASSSPNSTTSQKPSTPSKPPARTQQDYLLDLKRATSDAQLMGLYRRHLTYVQGQIERLEADKTLTAKQKQRLMDLYDERDKTQSDIDAIIDKREDAAEDAREKAAAKRAAKQKAAQARARARAAMQRDYEKAAAAATAALPGVGISPYAMTSAGFAKGGVSISEANRRAKAASAAAGDPLIAFRDELRARSAEQSAALMSVLEKFAPNFQLQTHVLEHLSREQIGVLRDLAEPARFRDTFPIGRAQGAVMDW